MSEQVTIQVSEQVLHHAVAAAASSRQTVAAVLSGWLESAVAEFPVQSLSDNEVLSLAKLNFTRGEQQRFSDLLERNRENLLDAEGRKELERMMELYERGLLRKAQALQEAVSRGLIAPLKP